MITRRFLQAYALVLLLHVCSATAGMMQSADLKVEASVLFFVSGVLAYWIARRLSDD